MKKLLQLENIELGELLSAINEAIGEVSADVADRPHKADARKVKIEIAIKPDVHESAGRTFNQPDIDWKVETTVPGKKGMTTKAFVEDGKLIVNTGMPLGGNPDQQTLFDKESQN